MIIFVNYLKYKQQSPPQHTDRFGKSSDNSSQQKSRLHQDKIDDLYPLSREPPGIQELIQTTKFNQSKINFKGYESSWLMCPHCIALFISLSYSYNITTNGSTFLEFTKGPKIPKTCTRKDLIRI